jgi:hypothetical protein
MNTQRYAKLGLAILLTTLGSTCTQQATAQTPVDDEGNVVGTYQASPAHVEPVVGNEDIPLLSPTDLEELVGPIALYPDDLLAIVLPASAYPLQIVDAARFLEELENDPSLEPDPEWDDSVVALLNYPEIIEHLNEDIDWTWRLGEAVVAQQADVVAAIERFRDRAYAAGNLKSDSYQNVTTDNGTIEITPVSEDVIYVPYYEPERVVVYQPRPVYYYYPRSYPVYYYPYSAGYHFDHGFFWGVTTAFSIGWFSDSLHVYHHSYHGHPYFGRSYWNRWWYRRPSINVYHRTYVDNRAVTVNRYYEGDRWQPRRDRREYVRQGEMRRNWNYDPRRNISREYASNTRMRSRVTAEQREPVRRVQPERRQPAARQARTEQRAPITFRDRRNEPRTPVTTRERRTEPGERSRQVRPTQPRETVAGRKNQPVRQIRPEIREPVTRSQPTRRDSRPTPQVRRETRPTPQIRTQSRPQPQVRSQSRQTPQVRTQSRPQPQVSRPARPAPKAQPSRTTPKPAQSTRKEPPKRSSRSDERR